MFTTLVRQVNQQHQAKDTTVDTMSSFLKQRSASLPYPTQTFTDRTVIVTGSNTGLGKEAARHIARLGTAKLILAVRSLEKGEAAKADIEQTTGCGKDIFEVWHLDMASHSSVLMFAERAERDLEKVDVLLPNAAIATGHFVLAEGNESTLTVNVISTLLLVLAMLPKMKATAQKSGSTPVITITSSGAHAGASFEERSAPEGKLFATLNEGKDFDAMQRYPTSKLLEVFCVKDIGEHHPKMPVTINEVDTGFCHS
jgi:NAD(P)-dependent dehydrogenase (short-subunit alcohol dehydrogenase family)